MAVVSMLTTRDWGQDPFWEWLATRPESNEELALWLSWDDLGDQLLDRLMSTMELEITDYLHDLRCRYQVGRHLVIDEPETGIAPLSQYRFDTVFGDSLYGTRRPATRMRLYTVRLQLIGETRRSVRIPPSLTAKLDWYIRIARSHGMPDFGDALAAALDLSRAIQASRRKVPVHTVGAQQWCEFCGKTRTDGMSAYYRDSHLRKLLGYHTTTVAIPQCEDCANVTHRTWHEKTRVLPPRMRAIVERHPLLRAYSEGRHAAHDGS